MSPFVLCLLLFASTVATAYAQPETPRQSLNQYVAFLNQSVGEITRRFQMVRTYQSEVNQYQKTPSLGLNLPSSGPLTEFYYRKALTTTGLTQAEKQRLTIQTEALWQLLNQLDQTGKALETYVRLRDYQTDSLKQSDKLIGRMQALFDQFSREKALFYQQIQRVYRRYHPHLPTDPYSVTEKEMEQVLLSQQQLLDSLPCYLNEESRSAWPVALVQQSILLDEKLLATFGKAKTTVDYPASSTVDGFRAALLAVQALKRRAVDDYTFAARQSARHGNAVYLSLLNGYNQDLLANHHLFVQYSQSARPLLDYPAFSPVLTPEPPPAVAPPSTQTASFPDKPLVPFTLKRAAAPATPALLAVLNQYVDFINESLRQLHGLQIRLRNYQSSAEYQRDPIRSRQRADLTYAHDDYKVPISAYQRLVSDSRFVPLPYRTAISTQAEVLLAMLREMDGLSIELIGYTSEKQYRHDQLKRSDAILDRYAYLFDTFDRKKEQLYTDLRRIHESYPVANPTSSWQIAGTALRKTLDNDTDMLFGIKAYVKGETTRLPNTDKQETDARQLIADEYHNLTGLQRYGRSNGLCPYSPYEDLAENTLRFAKLAQKVRTVSSASSTPPYEPFYYFYNNELVYQYNKFSELATTGLLRAINQPDVSAFRRLPPSKSSDSLPEKTDPTLPKLASNPERAGGTAGDTSSAAPLTIPTAQQTDRTRQQQHDTVYVERTRTDTVYVDRTDKPEVSRSLAGYAANNMVLLLDVSGSMDSPVKLPLLKRSVKSLLTLLRPEDQLSIVVYSGKARVVLKPTSGNDKALIARAIDELQSDGDTDGNKGLQLAYKVANKNYIRAGNNRIILATDGEFPISNDVLKLIGENARQDIYLTVFTFGRNLLTGQNLKKLSQLGRGTYAHVTTETADEQLIGEAKAITKKPVK